jgi:hypothetical protein
MPGIREVEKIEGKKELKRSYQRSRAGSYFFYLLMRLFLSYLLMIEVIKVFALSHRFSGEKDPVRPASTKMGFLEASMSEILCS